MIFVFIVNVSSSIQLFLLGNIINFLLGNIINFYYA